MDNRPIGVFDSGLGGLTVVKELMKCLPGENIIYFGDTARIPYGTRSNEAVIRYSRQSMGFLMSKGIKMIVIACNTVSSVALGTLDKEFKVPVLGVIGPGARMAANCTRNQRMGIIGTRATIRNKAYEKAIRTYVPNVEIYSMACTLFVPIAEEGWSNTKIALLTAEKYLDNMKAKDIDTLILGCTHFPLLEETIGQVMGPGVKLVNPAVGTALEVKETLRANNSLNENDSDGKYHFFVSDLGEKFEDIGGRFLGKDIKYIQKIDIEGY